MQKLTLPESDKPENHKEREGLERAVKRSHWNRHHDLPKMQRRNARVPTDSPNPTHSFHYPAIGLIMKRIPRSKMKLRTTASLSGDAELRPKPQPALQRRKTKPTAHSRSTTHHTSIPHHRTRSSCPAYYLDNNTSHCISIPKAASFKKALSRIPNLP